ncbi:MAG: HlyD family efflux transporter periplasmic adaptor subunit [Chloroflexota bacterium]|nr:HlyD family efflux transporter periplasmic adaptor subunit [Chloroflexota bacterium]
MSKSGLVVSRWVLLTAAGAVLVSACDTSVLPRVGGGAVGAPAAEPTIAAQTSTQQSRPTVPVRRATITDAIKVLGRVISSQEADLYFKSTNRLRGIFTETGQQVKAGDVLAELETGDLLTRIGQQKSLLETAQLKQEQSRAKSVLDDSPLEQEGVEQAQITLDQARLALEKVQSGTVEADLRTAEAALVLAQGGLEKARGDLAAKQADLAAKQADLGYKLAGALPADLAKAQADVDVARIKLQQASSPPRPEDVQTAELKLEQSRTKLAQLRDAQQVKPEDLANGEVTLRIAEVALEKARAETTGTAAQREANVRTAELAVEKARNDANKLKNQQVAPWDLRLAELEVQAGETAVAKLRTAPQFDAQTAKVALDLAQAKLEQLQRGPTEQDTSALRAQIGAVQLAIESARTAIPSAEAAVTAAQASLEAKRQGATEFDQRDAQYKVDKAQNDLDTARTKLDVKRANLGLNRTATGFDVQSAEKEVEKQQLELQRLEANFNDARIIAPFDGKVTKVNGKPGDNVQAFAPVISLSSPAQLLVQAQINEADMPKLAVGQRALITLDAFPGQTLNGTVRDLPSSVVTQQGVVADKNTKIVVEWTRPGAEIGMLARVQVVVQRKDDILVIPTNAIRTVGRRRFVEFMDGNVKRSRNIEVGISTDVDTEVVTGLDEGMTILAGT